VSFILLSLLCLFVATLCAQNPTPLSERAYQDREILYELQTPESHAFRITHDYTVRRVGEKYYFNVVRAGSHLTSPESIDLDTGEQLKMGNPQWKTGRCAQTSNHGNDQRRQRNRRHLFGSRA